MAEEGQDQNRSEEATPFKLKKAREKGSVARGIDLGFFSGLAAFACFLAVTGAILAQRLAAMMHSVLAEGVRSANDPQAAVEVLRSAYWPILTPILLFAGTILLVVGLVEVVQLRGLTFSPTPLKPDFSRVNPAKGLKRLFSLRMLKEAAKSIIKLSAYAVVAWLVVRAAMAHADLEISDAASLSRALHTSAMKLLWAFVAVALIVAAIDQLISRKEFGKQMRMSRRDITREHKEREGEPRMKAKRKQIHAELIKQAKGLAALPGSDMLVVNPEHYAVALSYDRTRHSAPMVRAKGRNLHALAMKRLAHRLRIPIVHNPPLARALFSGAEHGTEIPAEQYRAVAELYFKQGLTGAGTAETAQ